MVSADERCCGCTACMYVCPAKCISFTKKNGFRYPIIDGQKCIGCNVCEKICPINDDTPKKMSLDRAFYAYNKDNKKRRKSTSGGIFCEFAEAIIKEGGVVYGAAFDDNYFVMHKCIDRIDDIASLQGSKYSESDLSGIFPDIKLKLENNIQVLFSGTPCQCAGLKKYLNKEYKNLFVVDLFCYGIQSPEIWNLYLKAFHDKSCGISSIEMRNKEHGWKNYSMRIMYNDGTYYCRSKKKDPYLRGYSKGLFIRESCYDCQFKRIPRVSDVTLGDFWEVNSLYPDIDSTDGISLLLINNSNGEKLISYIAKNIVIHEIDVERLNRIHPNYLQSANKNKDREKFFKTVNRENFAKLINEYARLPISIQIPLTCKNVLLETGLWEKVEPIWNSLRDFKNQFKK